MTRPARPVHWDGTTERVATPSYWDGSSWRDAQVARETGATDPPPPPIEPTTGALMGAYMGNFNQNPDQGFQSLTGQWPDLMSQYYQADGVNGSEVNQSAENARMSRGTIPVLTFSMASSTQNPGNWTHAQVASGQADAWINRIANQIAALNDGEIWVTFDHEFEVKRNQNYYSTWTPTDAHYIGAFNRWHDIVKSARAATGKQQVKFMYWWGYSRATEINNIAMGITEHRPVDIFSFDPYVFSWRSPTETFEQMVDNGSAGKLSWARGRPWYQGQPIGLTEYGKDGVHGDANCATFHANTRARCEALGLAFAMYFSRDKAGDVMLDITPARTGKTSTGSMANYAQTVPAYIASVQAGGPNA